MKKYILSCLIVLGIIVGIGFALQYFSGQSTLGMQAFRENPREILQFSINPNLKDPPPVSVSANKLPEFTIDLTQEKFRSLIGVSKEKLAELVQASIVHKVYADILPSDISVDTAKGKLIIHPQDIPNFKPGMYKLSLRLRTIEGDVNLEQDFSWGVIAVNSNKSIYQPGETAKIGIGVLNDRGETRCMTGSGRVDDVTMTITDPQGKITDFSIADNTITDSGKCGANTVTNEADFQAKFPTTTSGIYQMTVTAGVNGKQRSITDYFKVDGTAPFDIERTSFPTRIYPPSPYPTTFTVIAKQDYHGTIIDTVPASFMIEHISDNGRTEKSGDFTKIIWQTNLRGGTPKTFTYFIKFPMISPEFYLLGPIQIGDFQEARQWQIASDTLNSTSGVVAYEDNGSSNTWSRIWTGTAWNPAPPAAATSMSTHPADSRWFREISSPQTGEKIVALVDNVAGGDRYFLFTWDGNSWTEDKNIGINAVNMDTTRAFDIAYEENSGDALFVYSDTINAQLKYYKRVSGSWDTASSSAGTAFDTYKKWIRMKPKFDTNQILVGYLTNNNRVGAMIWDGDSKTFGDQFDESTSSQTPTSSEQAFDVAYETSNGTPTVFWEGRTFNNIIYRQFDDVAGWGAEASGPAVFTAARDGVWLYAAADPVTTSNNISLALQENASGASNPVCRFAVWNGSTIIMNNNTVTCGSTGTTPTNNMVDTAFENTSGRAMFITTTGASASGQLSYLTWKASTGFSALTTLAGATSAIEGVQLYSDLNTNTMVALYHDDNATQCALYDREWDGDTNTWTSLGTTLHANMCASADNDTEPYGFGFDRNLETFAAYRWYSNNATSLGTLGVGDLVPLTATNSAYTLTSASQQFRMRFLLYYPDSLLTSTARAYKLQYVDPGSGTCASPTGGTPATWTDVGTAGSTLISYYDNAGASMNDKVPIATNSAEPSFEGLTRDYQNYIESNTFTNGRTNMTSNHVGIWDASLVDNTTYDRTAQTFCFRVARSNDLPLQVDVYPQITTASIADVKIQGGTLIQGGSLLQ